MTSKSYRKHVCASNETELSVTWLVTTQRDMLTTRKGIEEGRWSLVRSRESCVEETGE